MNNIEEIIDRKGPSIVGRFVKFRKYPNSTIWNLGYVLSYLAPTRHVDCYSLVDLESHIDSKPSIVVNIQELSFVKQLENIKFIAPSTLIAILARFKIANKQELDRFIIRIRSK